MVTHARVCWLLDQLRNGRQARLRVATHPDRTCVQVTLLAYRTHSMCNSIAIAWLELLLGKLDGTVAVDHGHRKSTGENFVSIVLKPIVAQADGKDIHPAAGGSSLSTGMDYGDGTEGGGFGCNPSAVFGDGSGGVMRVPAGSTETANFAASTVANPSMQHSKSHLSGGVRSNSLLARNDVATGRGKGVGTHPFYRRSNAANTSSVNVDGKSSLPRGRSLRPVWSRPICLNGLQRLSVILGHLPSEGWQTVPIDTRIRINQQLLFHNQQSLSFWRSVTAQT